MEKVQKQCSPDFLDYPLLVRVTMPEVGGQVSLLWTFGAFLAERNKERNKQKEREKQPEREERLKREITKGAQGKQHRRGVIGTDTERRRKAQKEEQKQ